MFLRTKLVLLNRHTIQPRIPKRMLRAGFRMYLLQDLLPSPRAWTPHIGLIESALKPRIGSTENV